MSRLIKEKDEQIAQLMEEGMYMYLSLSLSLLMLWLNLSGEKLSKQELQSNGVIKKLRQKDRGSVYTQGGKINIHTQYIMYMCI